MPEFSRRRFVRGALGGAAAAFALARAPATAGAATVLPIRSGLAWASGVRDNYPRAGERGGSRR